ncbi:MAG: SMI1/KNR4 family protein [Actinomycetota bacterium]
MAESLEEIERWVGRRLPEAYRRFLEDREEGPTVGERVALYGRNDFIEMNECMQVKIYCPQCVTIGNDGGGREILLALTNGRIGLVDAGSMDPADAYPLAEAFDEWLAGGCDLLDPPEEPRPEWVDLYLTRPPADGLKGLIRVVKLLDLTIPMSEFRGILSTTPCRLARNVDYLRYGWRCAEHNLTDPCLGAFAVDRPEQPVAIAPRAAPAGPPGLDLS